MSVETDIIREAYNSALSYAFKLENSEEALIFLNYWCEGDWESIKIDFPDFNLNTTMISQKIS